MYIYWALIFSKIDLYTIRRNTNGSLRYNRVIWIYSSVFFIIFYNIQKEKLCCFLSQSYIMHMHYWYLKWIHIFVFFVGIHPFWSQGSNSWTLLVDLWNMGSKWASSILHTFYIVQLYTVALFLFLTNSFFVWMLNIFLAIFSVFSMHIFLTIFCSLRTFFIIYVFEREIWELEGRNFSTKIFVFILREK